MADKQGMPNEIILQDIAEGSKTLGKRIRVQLTVSESLAVLSVENEHGDEMGSVAIDFFDGKLRGLIWQEEDVQNDPTQEATLLDTDKLHQVFLP